MRSVGTEINMLARLGFPKDIHNLEDGPRPETSGEAAARILDEGGYAHVLYAAVYRGKRCRNKTPLDIDLQTSDIECFEDDASFFKRANELYAAGVYWIGAFHAKN